MDEALLRKSPSEVAFYLLARRSSLATAVELGRSAPPHLDYTPLPDKRIPPEELVLELLVGVVPVVGEATDAAGLLVGYSITGRELASRGCLAGGEAGAPGPSRQEAERGGDRLPAAAGGAIGRAAACFYDHQRHLKPSRVPELRQG